MDNYNTISTIHGVIIYSLSAPLSLPIPSPPLSPTPPSPPPLSLPLSLSEYGEGIVSQYSCCSERRDSAGCQVAKVETFLIQSSTCTCIYHFSMSTHSHGPSHIFTDACHSWHQTSPVCRLCSDPATPLPLPLPLLLLFLLSGDSVCPGL